MRQPMQRPSDNNTAKPTPVLWKDSSFDANYPYLAEFLSCAKWNDGTRRQTGTLLFFVEEGSLKACLNDRDLGRSVFLTAATMALLLDAMEAGLAEDNLGWRYKK